MEQLMAYKLTNPNNCIRLGQFVNKEKYQI